MNGVHDIGGMHGFGPVVREEDEPVFHHLWEGRAFGLALAMSRQRVFIPGGFRFALESLEPTQYLASSYYWRWMLALEKALIQKGILAEEELEQRTDLLRAHPQAATPQKENPQQVKEALEAVYSRSSPHREVGIRPKFKVGDRVRARNINPSGHTRLPRYVRGKRGVLDRFHGVHDFDDARSEGLGPQPQPVYNVRFEARELWGEGAGRKDRIYIDMWESYLEPA